MTVQSNTEKTSELSFCSAYESFHPVVRRKIKAEITEHTGWSRLTFYNKKNGVHRISLSEQIVLTEVFAFFGVDAWTGAALVEDV